MINFALLGAGRIGKMHAQIISDHPEANLTYVYDVNNEFALQVAKDNNAEVANSPEEAVNHKDVNAIIYCGENNEEIKEIEKVSVENLKRVKIYKRKNWDDKTSQSPYFIEQCQEIKTTWHPTES